MRFQPIIALALFISGLLAAPAVAQQDERFFGRWERDNIHGVSVDTEFPGLGKEIDAPERFAIEWVSKDNIDYSAAPRGEPLPGYQVIWDFGEKVIVCICFEMNGDRFGSLKIFELDEGYREKEGYLLLLTVTYCYERPLDKFTFKNMEPEAIWSHILARPVPGPNEDSYGDCRMTEDRETIGGGWIVAVWERWVSTDTNGSIENNEAE